MVDGIRKLKSTMKFRISLKKSKNNRMRLLVYPGGKQKDPLTVDVKSLTVSGGFDVRATSNYITFDSGGFLIPVDYDEQNEIMHFL